MPVSPLAQKGKDVNNLIQEFQHYTKDWAHRLSLIGSHEVENRVPPQVLENLFTLIDKKPRTQETLQYRIQLFISSHLHQGLTLKDLSDFLGYSEKYCSEFFRQHMGDSFSSYLKNVRIQKAQHLLTTGLIGMTEIAEALGFKDQFAFSHFFKKAMGVSPREYRNHILKDESEAIDPEYNHADTNKLHGSAIKAQKG